MQINPEVIAVVGGIVTLAGIFYRHLLKQLDDEREECRFWREYALREVGLTELAKQPPKPPPRRQR